MLDYLIVFCVGGLVCLLGQILIIRTRMTSSRILVLFLMIGIFLEAVGLFEPLAEFAKAGITVPILGFGSSLAKGAIKGLKELGVLGIEMETFALFNNARKFGKNATALLTVSDLFFSDEKLSSLDREKNLNDMIVLALESCLKL